MVLAEMGCAFVMTDGKAMTVHKTHAPIIVRAMDTATMVSAYVMGGSQGSTAQLRCVRSTAPLVVDVPRGCVHAARGSLGSGVSWTHVHW